MYIRCADCLASSWIETLKPDGLIETVDCGSCSRRFRLNPIETMGTTARDHYRRALSFSNRHDLDMASSYSVLLGIMSLEQAEVLRHSALPAQAPDEDVEMDRELRAPSAAERADKLPLVPDFDLGFSKAIAEGHLTIQQAIARGDRDAFANRLIRRHGLPEPLAYRVTDNRTRLRDALAEKEELESETQRKRRESAARRKTGSATATRRGASRIQTFVVCAVAATLLAMLAWKTWNGEPEQDEPLRVARRANRAAETPQVVPATESTSEHLQSATRVDKDDFGNVVHVIGPDPSSVLVAFCESSPSLLGLSPVEVTSTVPTFRNARLGLFRDASSLESLFAIRIRLDGKSGRWTTGSGDRPVAVVEAPELPEDAVRIPVSEN